MLPSHWKDLCLSQFCFPLSGPQAYMLVQVGLGVCSSHVVGAMVAMPGSAWPTGCDRR